MGSPCVRWGMRPQALLWLPTPPVSTFCSLLKTPEWFQMEEAKPLTVGIGEFLLLQTPLSEDGSHVKMLFYRCI